MRIYFGLGLDDDIHLPELVQAGKAVGYVGPQRLLLWLEARLGFQGYPSGTDYLRIEQYRQLVGRYLAEVRQEVFFRASFEADQLATAGELLSRRDELLLANWDFEIQQNMPTRLQALAELEQYLSVEFITKEEDATTSWIMLSAGYADRFAQIIRWASQRKTTIQEVRLLEPLALLPSHFQRLFQALSQQGVTIIPVEAYKDLAALPNATNSDLGALQKRLYGSTKKYSLQADGSLLLLKSKRETTAAAYLAKLLHKNRHFQPTILISDKNRTLDNAFLQDGLPSLGTLSASSARPSLQILKLVTAFLWEPLDPFKLMEFVTLKMKPLEEELSIRVARQLSETPGINSVAWNIMISRYFDELTERVSQASEVEHVRQQYHFWFRRQRYNTTQRVPKEDAIEVYAYLSDWAQQQFDYGSTKNQSFLVLKEQADRIEELLETTPDTSLTYLELERVIRTIYEPSPVQFREQELGFCPFVHNAAAFIQPVQDLVWWNFIQAEPNHFFSRWYNNERNFLEQADLVIDTPKDENARLIWQRMQAVVHTRKRLVLVVPTLIEGKMVHEHPLQSDLKAAFGNLDAITLNIDTQQGRTTLEQYFELPEQVPLATYPLGQPDPFIAVPNLKDYLLTDYETFTSLNTLFYYPYQWVFKYKTRLVKSSILSVVKDTTLLGNLAHRFFEEMLKEEQLKAWQRTDVNQWIDQKANALFKQEGAVLLMYGREPDKVNFLNRLKYSAWSLISSLQKNNWTVKATEMSLEDQFMDVPLRAKADLVLQREEEFAVLDLKWHGVTYRHRMIKNREDLQLVLYSHLLEKTKENWAHTAYFIIEQGQMIARNQQAFEEVNAIDPDCKHGVVHQEIMNRMEATYTWRQAQVTDGFIEVRCTYTEKKLNDAYEQHGLTPISLDMLEMKSTDAPFDDYRVLIKLVN
ncbi:MAG: PD-(D/E)XK nuclease family protein [Bacteroidota bacterium]